MDEVVRGFVGFLAKELDIRVLSVSGRIDHESNDSTVTKPEKVIGLLCDDSPGTTIAVVSGKTPELRRSSEAHELAHVLLGDVGVQHRTIGITEYRVENVAAEILMPARYTERVFRDYFRDPIIAQTSDERLRRLFADANRSIPRNTSAQQLADEAAMLAAQADGFGYPAMNKRFGVSISAMGRRLRQLGLVRLPISTGRNARIGSMLAGIDQTKKSGHLRPLSKCRLRELVGSVTDFFSWLKVKLDVSPPVTYAINFVEPTNEDWLMRVDGNLVEFNPAILSKSSFSFYELVVLHESFHLFVQGLPNKRDVTELKDDFGDVPMRLMDVEADFYAAQYLKERRGRSLSDILKLYHEGSSVFADPEIRVPKFERFIGSILSIVSLFQSCPGVDATSACDLYLPSVANIQIAGALHLLVAPKAYFYSRRVSISERELEIIKSCYARPADYSLEGYVSHLLRFAQNVLGQRVS